MPLPTIYNTGTASVANGATTVTLVGAVSGAIYAGDLFCDPAQPLVPPQRIATDPVAGVFELAVAWPGTSMTSDPYEVRITPDSARVQERTREVLNALQSVTNTGIGIDAFGTFAERTSHDAAATGFAYLSIDGDGGLVTDPVVFIKNTAASADWSDAILITGPQGEAGLVGEWLGPWVTATAYALNDVVSNGGSSYICVEAHTSGTFATDLAAVKWEIVAQKGDTGATGAAGSNGTNGTNGVDGKFSGTEVIKTAAYTALAADVGKTIILNKATADTLSFDAAATLGSTWMVMVKNIGAGTWSLDPSGAETIDGAATISLAQNESVVVSCNGAALRSLFRGSAAFTQFTAASSAGPAQLDFAEDTDNGTNKISVVGQSTLSADRTFTLPDATGTALVGALGATDNRLLRSDGTGGSTAQNSAVSVDDSGNMSGVANFTSSGTFTSGGNAFFGQSTSFTGVSAGTLGPDFTSYHNSASPAAADSILYWQMLGNDSGGNLTGYAILRALIEDPTNGSEDGGFDLQLMVAGVATLAAKFAPGLVLGAPTGGQKGIGTLNATAVYDDNTLLTCMALQEEFLDRGEVDIAKWDDLVPDLVTPERVEHVPATFTETRIEVVPVTEDVDGRLVRRFVEKQVEVEKPLVWADPVYDEEGNIVDAVETPLTDEVVVPEQIVSRTHGTARLFAEMLAEGFDPRDPAQYIARLRADQALPGMPTRSTWEHNSLSGGEMFNRLWLATEMLAIVVMNHEERLAELENE